MKSYAHVMHVLSSLLQVLVCPEDTTVVVLPHPVMVFLEYAIVTYSAISLEIVVLIFKRLDAFRVC